MTEKQKEDKLFGILNDSVEYKTPLRQLIKYQWENFVSILFSFAVVLMSAIARGGEGRESVFGF